MKRYSIFKSNEKYFLLIFIMLFGVSSLRAYNSFNCSTSICDIAMDEAPSFTWNKDDGYVYFDIAMWHDFGVLSVRADDMYLDFRYPGESYETIFRANDNAISGGGSYYSSQIGFTIHYWRNMVTPSGSIYSTAAGQLDVFGSRSISCGTDNRGWGGSSLKFRPPANTEIQSSMEFRYSTEYAGESCGGVSNLTRTLNIDLPDKPINVTATSNTVCNHVALTWNPPSSIQYNNFRNYEIYRDGVSIATVSGTTFSYNDTGADSDGSSHNYTIRTKIAYPGGRNLYSDATSSVIGSRKSIPEPPASISIPSETCDGNITVNWSSSPGAESYIITWFNTPSDQGSTSGIVGNTYTITNVQRGAEYDIRVRATSSCGSGSFTSYVYGESPPEPVDPSSVSVSQNPSGSLQVTWPNQVTADNYIVIAEKTNSQNISTTSSPVSLSTNSYEHIDVEPCHSYTFTVKSTNVCNTTGGVGTSSAPFSVESNLFGSFDATGLTGSKGYYSNRVELTWNIQNNAGLLDGFEIFRKELGAPGQPTKINTINNPNSFIFLDYFADAGVLYEYSVYGYGECNDSTIYTETVSDVGFRNASGTISGVVSYQGGVAVEDVKVIVENSTTGAVGNSHYFNGTTHAQHLNPLSGFPTHMTVEGWVKLDGNPSGDWRILSDCDGTFESIALGGNSSDFEFYIENNLGSSATVSVPINLSFIDEYVHLAGVYSDSQDSIYLYVNGELVGSTYTTIGSIEVSAFCMGDGLTGNIDEARWWNVARDSLTISKFHTIGLAGNQSGLVGLWKLDEAVGNAFYDLSRVGTSYNKHDLNITGSTSWSTDVPTANQLATAAYTASNGSYTVVVPYSGVGGTVSVTPTYPNHNFNPVVTTLYIGDGAGVHNNINFTDQSSFTVEGYVTYQNTNCGVGGANLLIDGEQVILNGQPVLTDATGFYSIQVPIGQHFVSVEQAGHVYSAGKFPPGQNTTFDFQQPRTINFEDATLVKLVGRVVGGLREGNKLPNLGLSSNNIGVTEVTFTSQSGCIDTTILTDAATGEYEIYLPPLSYVPDVVHPSNPLINQYFVDNGDLALVNLTQNTNEFTVIDTISFDPNTGVGVFDSTSYNRELNYIYRVEPTIIVKDLDGVNDFIGDTAYTFLNPITGLEETRNLRTDPMLWPVFNKVGKEDDFTYSCLIKVYEEYTHPSGAVDSVPTTDGTLRIVNNLSKSGQVEDANGNIAELSQPEIAIGDVNTEQELNWLKYSFVPGTPSFTENSSIPSISFTKTFEVELITNSSFGVIPWVGVPASNLTTVGDLVYRGYLMGTKSDGTQFFTKGPSVVDYVLRDPPGSASYSAREVGSTTTKEQAWSWDLGTAIHTEDIIYVGSKFSVGVGVSTETDVQNNVVAGFEASINGGNSGAQSVTKTNTQAWTTNAGPGKVGADSDLFIGSSKNVQFGISETLSFLPTSECGSVECLQDMGNGFSLVRKYGFSVVPVDYETHFIISADQIKNYLIPDLIMVRNTLLQTMSEYTSNLPIGDANYGKNNDDPVFTNAVVSGPEGAGFETMDGPSYTFTPTNLIDSLDGDTVRKINIQIGLWEDALKANEEDKLAINDPSLIQQKRNEEMAALNEQYEGVIAGYVAANIASGGALAVIIGGLVAPIPQPGYAIAGGVTFAVATGSQIALQELYSEYLQYVADSQRIAAKYNELQNYANGTLQNNITFNGGNTFTQSVTHETSTSRTTSLEYNMSAGLRLEIDAKINNNGLGYEKGIDLNFSSGRDWSTSTESTETVTYYLEDPDLGDFFSVDVYPSLNGWGPIFKTRPGGQSSCPHEGAVMTEYVTPAVELSAATLQREKPSLSVAPSLLQNVPVDDAAVFNLTVGNESESGDWIEYTVELVASSNPFGAIVSMNGSEVGINLALAPGQAVNQVLSVEKGPGPVYNYDSLLIVVHSQCQYAAGTSSEFTDIADSIYVSAHFLPACTDIELIDPDDNWVINNSFEDTLSLYAGGYNINYFDLEHINFEYKPSNQPNWIGLQSFFVDTAGQPSLLPIPTSTAFTPYDWIVNQLLDGDYDLRVSSTCLLANAASQTYSGTIDRINPHPFGTPAPADGILDANEDISIRFNEPVDLGAINQANFDIRGVLNETEISHSTSLFFDGIDDKVEVSGGANIQKRDFTIEFWAKRASLGNQALVTQGAYIPEELFIGFDATDHLVFRIGNEEIITNNPITDFDWHHYAFTYHFDNETMEIYQDQSLINNGNINFFTDFETNQAMYFGYSKGNLGLHFNGNMHEVRVWNKYRTLAEIATTANTSVPSGQLGLLYNWRMDEATDIFVKDHIRRRDGVIDGATWQVNPNGYAYAFDGVDDYIDVADAGNVAITNEMDMTLEFWFNSSTSNAATLFANGSGEATQSDSLTSWNIEKDAAGLIHVKHNGLDFVATNNNFFDGEWHHFALVLRRTGNLSAYVDGNLQNSIQASNFNAFGGANMYLGARGYYLGSVPTTDNYFEGMLDEFRVWNTARKIEQVTRDKQNRLLGDELGLLAYLPFEEYQIVMGGPVLTANLFDAADGTHTPTAINGASSVSTTPTIKLQRPVESIGFTYSVNNDEIIITPTVPPASIENVTIDITVAGILDLNGNEMQSPKTWIAYMDKNQVIWQDDVITLEKDFGTSLTFTSAVINNGGEAKVYDITNMPEWLTASQTTGSIAPNSVQNITFTIDPNTNIGDYTEDIHLTTDFGYPEKLALNLKVREEEPDWNVNPADYEYSMNIIGMLSIEGVISTDEEDIIAAFVGDEIRGNVHLQYAPSFDAYYAYLDVYSNTTGGDEFTFKIWDASKGNVYVDVIPNLTFTTNATIGTLFNPQLFEAGNKIVQDIPLVAGWNWIGFNLASADSMQLDTLMASYTPTNGDLLKGQELFAGYTSNHGWKGVLNVQGVKSNLGYRLKANEADTLRLTGTVWDPTTRNIQLENNWNWIGFVSIRNQSVTQALGNLNATDGDIIKGKTQFAVYDSNLGWVGSLTTLTPGSSYLYNAGTAQNFTYPYAGAFKSETANPEVVSDERWPVNHGLYPTNMTHITTLDLCDVPAKDVFAAEDWYLGVFDEQGNCRAINNLTEVHNQLIAFMTIAGERNENVSYRLINKETGSAYTSINRLHYAANEMRGDFSNPYTISFSEEDCKRLMNEAAVAIDEDGFKVYPTIFDHHLKVEYVSEVEDEVSIQIYSNIGELVYAKEFDVTTGINNIELLLDDEEHQLAAGTYFFELVTPNNDKKRAKIVHF